MDPLATGLIDANQWSNGRELAAWLHKTGFIREHDCLDAVAEPELREDVR